MRIQAAEGANMSSAPTESMLEFESYPNEYASLRVQRWGDGIT